ncbi:hypothetical protein ACHAO7_011140 [Fusarium culmorum]
METDAPDVHVCEALCLRLPQRPSPGCIQDKKLDPIELIATLRRYIEQAKIGPHEGSSTVAHPTTQQLAKYLFAEENQVIKRFNILVNHRESNAWTCSSPSFRETVSNFEVEPSKIYEEFGRCAPSAQKEVRKLSKTSKEKGVSFREALRIAGTYRSEGRQKRWTASDIKKAYEQIKAR